jgi:hypothetical protein
MVSLKDVVACIFVMTLTVLHYGNARTVSSEEQSLEDWPCDGLVDSDESGEYVYHKRKGKCILSTETYGSCGEMEEFVKLPGPSGYGSCTCKGRRSGNYPKRCGGYDRLIVRADGRDDRCYHLYDKGPCKKAREILVLNRDGKAHCSNTNPCSIARKHNWKMSIEDFFNGMLSVIPTKVKEASEAKCREGSTSCKSQLLGDAVRNLDTEVDSSEEKLEDGEDSDWDWTSEEQARFSQPGGKAGQGETIAQKFKIIYLGLDQSPYIYKDKCYHTYMQGHCKRGEMADFHSWNGIRPIPVCVDKRKWFEQMAKRIHREGPCGAVFSSAPLKCPNGTVLSGADCLWENSEAFDEEW